MGREIERGNLHDVRQQITEALDGLTPPATPPDTTWGLDPAPPPDGTWKPVYTQDEAKQKLLDEAWPTGLFDGGELNIVNAGANIEVIAGSGTITDSYTDPLSIPTKAIISWATQDEAITGAAVAGTQVWFTMSNGGGTGPDPNTELGVLVQHLSSPTPAQTKDAIFLGYVIHNGLDWGEVSSPTVVNNVVHTVDDLLNNVAGPIFIEDGGTVHEAANLQLDRDAGTVWEQNRAWHVDRKDPHRETFPAQPAFSWRTTNRDFTTVSVLENVVDGDLWDNAGVVEPLGGGAKDCVIHRMYVDARDNYWLLLGQNRFPSYIDASANLGADNAATVIPTFLGKESLLLGYAIVERTSADWAADMARWLTASAGTFSSGGGTSPVSRFIDLADTPAVYAGSDGKSALVNATEDGLEFEFPDHTTLLNIGEDDHHNRVHVLYGDDNHSDVLIGGGLIIRSLLASPDGTTFQPETRMNYRGAWGPGTYEVEDVVVDLPYTMVANKTTQDRAAPQPIGSPTFTLPEFPAWLPLNEIARVGSGHLYSFTETVEINAIRVWPPTVGGDVGYIMTVILDGLLTQTPLLDLNAGVWNIVAVDSFIALAGSQLIVLLEANNSGTTNQVTGGWARGINDNANEPADQSWNRNTQNTLVRIDFDDLNATGRQAELEGIIAGSEMTFLETAQPDNFITYRTVNPPVTGATSVSYDVIEIDRGVLEPTVGQNSTMTAEIPIAASTDYVGILNEWTANQPIWGTIASALFFDGVDQGAPPDNAYGVDIAVQRLSISPDWDLLATSQSSGGGGEGTPFPEAPNDGQVYGRDGQAIDWEPVYSKIESDALYEPLGAIRQWITETVNRTAAWAEAIMVPSPATVTIDLPEADNLVDDILIMNSSSDALNGPDVGLAVSPFAGRFFVIDGKDTVVDADIVLKPGELVRITTRALNVSYNATVEAAGAFDGAGTFGLVKDPVTESGRFLSDSGQWVAAAIVPPGGITTGMTFETATTNTPPSGSVRMNNADPALATELYINTTNDLGNDISLFLQSLRDGDFIGYLDNTGGGGTYYWTVDAPGSIAVGVFTVSVTTESVSGAIPNLTTVDLNLVGNPQNRLPAGGLENQHLAKASSVDFDTEWVTPTGPQDEPPQDGFSYARYWAGAAFGWTTSPIFSGNVGIGLAPPGGQDLYVYNATTFAEIEMVSADDADGGFIYGGSVGSSLGDNYLGWFGSTNAKANWLTMHGDEIEIFAGAGYETQVQITAVGMGIGKSAPDSLLHLNGQDPMIILQDQGTGLSTVDAAIRIAESGASNVVDNFVEMAYRGGAVLGGTNGGLTLGTNNDPNVFFMDQQNGRIGIRELSPAHELHITAATPVIRIEDSTDGKFVDYAYDFGSVLVDASDTSNFRWRNSAGSNELMRLTNTGLGLGVTAPTHKLEIGGATPTINVRNDTAPQIFLARPSGGSFRLRNDGGVFRLHRVTPDWNGAATEILSVTSDHLLRVKTGYRGGENGTVATPVFLNGTGISYTGTRIMHYMRLGNFVFVTGRIQWAAMGADSSDIRIGTLPFTVSTDSEEVGGGTVTEAVNVDYGNASDNVTLLCAVESAQNSVIIKSAYGVDSPSGNAGLTPNLSYNSLGNTGVLAFSLMYITSDP